MEGCVLTQRVDRENSQESVVIIETFQELGLLFRKRLLMRRQSIYSKTEVTSSAVLVL